MAAEEFKISYRKPAEKDLDSLSTYDQRLIVDAIEKHLQAEPTKESKTRIKKMKQPFWSEYRLRVGEYRVYYNVDEEECTVTVVRVFEKGRSETPKGEGMKQIELSKDLRLARLLKRISKEDIVLTHKGHPVALLREFDDEDLEWCERERDPGFIESLKRRRRQVEQGETISHEDLKKKLGIHEPFETFLWKEVERLLGDGKNGQKPWTKLKGRCLEVLEKNERREFETKFAQKRCTIRYEKRSPPSLKALLVKELADQEQPISSSTEQPLVIVEFQKKKILVDGKKRRSAWLQEKRTGPFSAIIIRVAQ